MADIKQLRDDTIAALMALGHKRKEAARMVDAARNNNPGAMTVQDLLRAAYSQPIAVRDGKPTAQQVASGRGMAYYAYQAGSSAQGMDGDIVRIARAIGPGLSLEDFTAIAKQVESVYANRGSMTNAAFQAALWAIPDAFRAGRRDPVHFAPLRDEAGAPLPESSIPSPSSDAASLAPEMPSMPPSAQAITAMLNAEPTEPPSPVTTTIDRAQTIADVVGVFDQTGVTDLANGGVSLMRAFAEPARAGEHLVNAAVSAVSAIPIVGDVAKLAKTGTKATDAAATASKVNNASALAPGSPAATTSGKARFGSGVNAAAQAALTFLGMGATGGGGSSGGGGSGGMAGGGGAAGGGGNGGGGGVRPTGSPATGQPGGGQLQQAAGGLNAFSSAVQNFLNNTGAAGALLASVGVAVYERALMPIVDWLRSVDETSKQMLESNRKFADLNGQMAATFQQLDYDRFRRDVDQAAAMAGPNARLAKSQSGFEQAQQNLFQPYQRLGTDIQAWRTDMATWFLKLVDGVDFIGNMIEQQYNEDKAEKGLRNDAEKAMADLDEKLAPPKVGPPAPVAPAPPAPRRMNADQANRVRGWRW